MDDIFWPGVAAMAVLYVAVFATGVFASRLTPDKESNDLDELMLAGRSLPLWVGLLTMTATWVGGGYINGTAETTWTSGVLWGGQAGIGYALSLLLGGLVFAVPMRKHRFSTLVDPLEARYGSRVAAVLMVPAVLAELFWSAAILVALGSAFGSVIGLGLQASIVLSASVAIAYTTLGGLRAVAYTDVIQLVLIVGGLLLALPYAIAAGGGWSAVTAAATTDFGFSSSLEAISYGDWCVVLILGGIPWNVYFQRVLSTPGPNAARWLSIGAGPICAAMAIPPILIGLAARGIDWAVLASPEVAAALQENPALVLPMVLRWAVPTWVAVIGLGAVSAAVMSSVDSSVLSASSLVAWNGYRRLYKPDASADELARVIRVLVVVLGVFATGIALSVSSVAALWYLCGDVVYCVLFPQLSLALFDPRANRTGALAGLATSTLLRLGGGDATLGLPAWLPYPAWEGADFPFRTVAMCGGLVTAWVVARVTQRQDPARPLPDVDPPSA